MASTEVSGSTVYLRNGTSRHFARARPEPLPKSSRCYGSGAGADAPWIIAKELHAVHEGHGVGVRLERGWPHIKERRARGGEGGEQREEAPRWMGSHRKGPPCPVGARWVPVEKEG